MITIHTSRWYGAWTGAHSISTFQVGNLLNPQIDKTKKLDLLFILQYKVQTKGETIVFYI